MVQRPHSSGNSVILQPETLSILSVLHILEMSKRCMSINLNSQTFSSTRFAKAIVTFEFYGDKLGDTENS